MLKNILIVTLTAALGVLAAVVVVPATIRSKTYTGNLQQPIQEVLGPAEMVGFTAKILKTGEHEHFEGRYYRDHNGSFREEGVAKRRDGSNEKGLSIFDAPTGTTYIFRESVGWGKAIVAEPAAPTAQKARYRLAQEGVVDGLVKLPYKISGLEVYQQSGGIGQQVIAPALNFFAVVYEAANGSRREYTDIVVGEPPAELFKAPDGVSFKDFGSRIPRRPQQ